MSSTATDESIKSTKPRHLFNASSLAGADLSNRIKYSLFGMLFGAGFPALAWFYIDNPTYLFTLICTAPIVLGAVASIAGRKKDLVDHEVSVRTKDLQNAIALADQAVKAKANFLASMSHEIRTPLNGVLSCTNLLLDNLNKPENIQLLKTIQNSGNGLLTIINDILDFSKIESEKISLEYEAFSLNESLDQIIDLMSSKASENGIGIASIKTEDTVDWILGDVTRYRQILTNLIGNAIKFAHSNVKIKVSSRLLTRNSQLKEGRDYELLVEVIDDGIGISEKGQQNLFKSFSQADSSTTRKFGGTGLGLVICKGIVTAMQGEIGVRSKENLGATFYFKIPVKDCLPVKASVPLSLAVMNPKMAKKYPLKILMAEDNRINQMVATKILEKLGYRIDVVANGKEAVRAVRNLDYDLVLMDQHMPEMDGVEATKRIRRLGPEINQPNICALTASAFKEDKERCMAAGMNGFLTKPIDIQSLVAHLQSCQPSSDPCAALEIPVINYDAIYEQFEGVTDVIPEITDDCLKYLPELVSSLKTAITNTDAKAMHIAAHTLKGVLANFKADLLTDIAYRLEVRGRDENFENIEIDIGLLEMHLISFTQELKKLKFHSINKMKTAI